jgi:hypothetical protein
MTWADAVELEVSRGGNHRYRWLCSDDNPDAEQRAAYRAFLVRKATGQPEPATIPLRVSIRAARLGFQKCWFSTKDSDCGCSGVRCHLLERIVSLDDCVRCLKL